MQVPTVMGGVMRDILLCINVVPCLLMMMMMAVVALSMYSIDKEWVSVMTRENRCSTQDVTR